jgi:hypothetical protein
MCSPPNPIPSCHPQQVQQLEELLDFLRTVEPFHNLPRDRLTSLAIFCRPSAVNTGEVVVQQGQAVDTLYMVRCWHPPPLNDKQHVFSETRAVLQPGTVLSTKLLPTCYAPGVPLLQTTTGK